MIRITLHQTDDGLVLKLEGALTREWVGELEAAWREARHSRPRRPLRVDLRGVCRIDDRGQALLARIYGEGAEFVASGIEIPAIVREIAGAERAALVERN